MVFKFAFFNSAYNSSFDSLISSSVNSISSTFALILSLKSLEDSKKLAPTEPDFTPFSSNNCFLAKLVFKAEAILSSLEKVSIPCLYLSRSDRVPAAYDSAALLIALV